MQQPTCSERGEAMPPVIPECRADADPDVMYDALDQAGCLVVHDMADAGACARVRAELADYVEAAPAAADNPEDFYPGKTHLSLIHI